MKIAPNVVIKCPLTVDGLEATRILNDEGIKVNVTLCFSSAQAVCAAKAGASFISPFLGRLDDIGDKVYGCLKRSSRSTTTTDGKRKCSPRVCDTRFT